MPGICRIGIDTAGGVIIGVVQDGTVFANGALVSVDNDPVQGHGPGVHAGPTMIAGILGFAHVAINAKLAKEIATSKEGIAQMKKYYAFISSFEGKISTDIEKLADVVDKEKEKK